VQCFTPTHVGARPLRWSSCTTGEVRGAPGGQCSLSSTRKPQVRGTFKDAWVADLLVCHPNTVRHPLCRSREVQSPLSEGEGSNEHVGDAGGRSGKAGSGELNPPFEDFRAALTMTRKTPATAVAASRTVATKRGRLAGASDRAQDHRSHSGLALALTDILSGTGSSKTSLVELRGLEPLTPTLPVWCATSCAIAPSRANRSYTTGNTASKSLVRATC
jgi:hypothetical protein